jgi:hypothetical protein
MLPLLLLPLLLLPALAWAQSPLVPLTWAMQAPACTPAETATPYRFTTQAVLTFRPGAFHAPQPGRNAPLVVRCPVTGQGDQLMNRLTVLARDPDGHGAASRLLVQVLRHRVHLAPAAPVTEVLATYDSNRDGPDQDGWHLRARGVSTSVARFATETYTVEIALRRTSALVLSPRIATVRLDYSGPQPD